MRISKYNPSNNVVDKNFESYNSRQRTFQGNFVASYWNLKRTYGSGDYSWTEGINRKIARSIARDIARGKYEAKKED